MLARSLFRLFAVAGMFLTMQGAAWAQYEPYFIVDTANYSGTWKAYSDPGLTPLAGPGTSGSFSGQLYAYLNNGTVDAGGGDFWTMSGAGANTQLLITSFDQTTTPPTFSENVNSSTVFTDSTFTAAQTNQNGSTSNQWSIFDPNETGNVSQTFGDWVWFNFNADATGLDPSTPDFMGTPTSEANGSSGITGTFQGLFYAAGGQAFPNSDPVYYLVDFTVNGFGTAQAGQSLFVANAVPEPASCVAFAMVLAAGAGYGYRRKKLMAAAN